MEEPNLILHSIVKEDQEYVALRFRELLEKEFLEDVQIRVVQNQVQKVLECNSYLTHDKQSIIGMVKDISKPKEHEDYLINFGARKDAILDMVSQNLSTPLNLSKFTVDLIEKAVQERKFNKLDAHIDLIREVTAECIKVIDNLIQHEHLVSPHIHMKRNRFDVVAKISVVLEKLKEAHPDKQFRLRSDVNHLFIDGDQVKFLQIVQNLLSNSIKFTRHHGVIESVIKNHANKAEIIIKDDGIGIPDELKPFVFQKHTRGGRPGLNGEISNGIGLYVRS
jgi:two-component system sensor histidine kinase VicK